jgi:hypothetical protein
MGNYQGLSGLRLNFLLMLVILSLLSSACLSDSNRTTEPLPTSTAIPTYLPFTTTNLNIPGWNRLLAYDAIRPIYDPIFISVAEASEYLQGSELVMGVAWEGQAKAYPVTVLNRREMVNDDLAGIPYLVSW